MDELRSLIHYSDIIQMYDQFLKQTLVPVVVFSDDQISVINSFLNAHNYTRLIKRNEVDMMACFQIFESMKQFMLLENF